MQRLRLRGPMISASYDQHLVGGLAHPAQLYLSWRFRCIVQNAFISANRSELFDRITISLGKFQRFHHQIVWEPCVAVSVIVALI
jgi:hypothetical protein